MYSIVYTIDYRYSISRYCVESIIVNTSWNTKVKYYNVTTTNSIHANFDLSIKISKNIP